MVSHDEKELYRFCKIFRCANELLANSLIEFYSLIKWLCLSIFTFYHPVPAWNPIKQFPLVFTHFRF